MFLFKKKLLLCLLTLGLCTPAPAVQADEIETRRAVEKVLREKPELVLDILRNNSEVVLEIAQQGSNSRRRRNLEAQWQEDIKTKKDVRVEGRPVMGPKNAKVAIVAFSDFTCHYCEAASSTLESLFKVYGDDMSLVFKSLPSDEKGSSMLASKYFLAIGLQDESKAWSFYKRMFAKREQLAGKGGVDFIKKTVQELGLDVRKVGRDAESRKVLDLIREDQEDADKFGVEGTPYFLVNNLVLRGALPLDLFTLAVETAKKTGK